MTMKMSFTALGAAVLGAIVAVLLPALWRGAPESVVGEDVRVGDVTAEALTAFADLCSRRREATPSMIHVAMADPSTRQEEVEDAWAEFDRLCVAGEESGAHEVVRQLDSIRGRVMEIERSACGPEFGINWPYHLGMVRSAEDSEEMVRYIRAIDKSLSYYEYLAARICSLRKQTEERLGELDERHRSDISRNLRAALVRVIRVSPRISEICTVLAKDEITTWDGRFPSSYNRSFSEDVASECPRKLLFPNDDGEWVNVRNFAHLRRLAGGHILGFFYPGNGPINRVDEIRSQVCVHRFSSPPGTVADLEPDSDEPDSDPSRRSPRRPGSMLFTNALLGWRDMESLERDRYRDLFERIANAVNSSNANICADIRSGRGRRTYTGRSRPQTPAAGSPRANDIETGRSGRGRRTYFTQGELVLWSIATDVIDAMYTEAKKAVEKEAVDRFIEEYAMEHYVGRQLEVGVNLERIYSLEYYDMDLTPEDVSRERYDRTPLGEVVGELIEDFKRMVKEDKDRDFERWKLQLEADTQIEKAAIDAGARIEKAKIESAVRRYEANMKYKTELAKIRAQDRARPGFFGKLLGAVTGMLGSDAVAKGVVDLVVPKPPAPPAPPSPSGTVERTTTTVTTTTPDGKSIERTETESEKLPLGGR